MEATIYLTQREIEFIIGHYITKNTDLNLTATSFVWSPTTPDSTPFLSINLDNRQENGDAVYMFGQLVRRR